MEGQGKIYRFDGTDFKEQNTDTTPQAPQVGPVSDV
jgi:hypothetical protein